MRVPDRHVVRLSLTRDGRLAEPEALDHLAARVPTATDCFVFCPGWRHDRHVVLETAARFFSLLDRALTPVGERVTPLRVAVHWPSTPFADDGQGGTPDLVLGLGEIARSEPGRLEQVLRAMAEVEVPQGPEEELELEGLRRGLQQRETRGALSPAHALAFWVMKRRAGQVGERLGREHLGPLFAGRPLPRLHLIGHSFGAKLVTSAVLGGLAPRSLTLLLAAFSAFAFAPEVPEVERPGVYHPLLAERRVQGPIVVLHSSQDRALGSLYPAVTGWGQIERGRHAGRAGEIVARSALGAVGARGVGAPTLELREALRIGLPARPIVNVDGSRVVRASEWLLGAHRDIDHLEIATLIGMAAGLLRVGAPPMPRSLPIHLKGGAH